MALYVAIGVCALIAATLVYRYDLYEREPWYMLVLALALGTAGMRLVSTVEHWSLVPFESLPWIAAIAAVQEELARLLIVTLLALVFPSQLDDPMDGIVYGSIVGLGMALEESFSLVWDLPSPELTRLPVEIVRLLGHLVMAGIVGYGVGLARAAVPDWRQKLARCFGVAFALHFVWDWVALQASDGGELDATQTAIAMTVMLVGIYVYGSLVVTGSRLSKARFASVDRGSLWGWPFTVFLRRRRR